jgi:hypothetical protein
MLRTAYLLAQTAAKPKFDPRADADRDVVVYIGVGICVVFVLCLTIDGLVQWRKRRRMIKGLDFSDDPAPPRDPFWQLIWRIFRR